jgi:hypothetical protein
MFSLAMEKQGQPLSVHQRIIKGKEKSTECDGGGDECGEWVGHGFPQVFKGSNNPVDQRSQMKKAKQAQATTVKSAGPAHGYLLSASWFMVLPFIKIRDDILLDVDRAAFGT